MIYDDERWARGLFNLRLVLWPNGKLDVAARPPVSKEERTKLREQAVTEIKKFLPSERELKTANSVLSCTFVCYRFVAVHSRIK